jgi:SEC-C motif
LAHLVFHEFGIPRDELAAIGEGAERAFTDLKPARRAGMGPYDPCWCGSGKNLKFCHEE